MSPTLAELTARVRAFSEARDWGRFHSPRNLAMALSVEASELLEVFLWTADDARLPPEQQRRAEDEAADVLLCLLNFCDRAGIDLGVAFERKLAAAELKYPADRVRGKALKYDQYPEFTATTGSAVPLAAEPFGPFGAWFDEAKRREPDVPDAMALSTADADGTPSVRMVLLKSFGPDGFVFYTNRRSRKGCALLSNPLAAGVLHWKSLERQAIVEGRVELLDDAASDAYFASRPRASQLGAWASEQGQPISDMAALDAAVQEVATRFDDGPVPRPPFWGGFRIVPERIELWQGRGGRMHERVEWRLQASSEWTMRRLQP